MDVLGKELDQTHTSSTTALRCGTTRDKLGNLTTSQRGLLDLAALVFFRGDLRDTLHLRQNLLRTALSVLTWKNSKIFNERMVIYLPAAWFALCSGSASFLHCDMDLAASNFFLDALLMEDELSMAEDRDQAICYELYACAPEVLAEINIGPGSKAGQSRPYQSVRLPRQISDPLLHELEYCILEAVVHEKIEKLLLSDVLFISALLSNIMYSSHMTRISKEVSPFVSKIGRYMSDLLECAFFLTMFGAGSANLNLLSLQAFCWVTHIPRNLEVRYTWQSSTYQLTACFKGILSTERGQQALRSFDSYERSLIEVHSKGVNLELVQNSLLELDRKFDADQISVEKSDIWKTHGKSFETWICSLVYALIGHCDDIILRLCQDLVLQKAEVAEILFPNVMVNLAGRKNLDFDLCKLISSKVLENIFVESNVMVKSIQVMLNALNEVRLCHVMERTGSSLVPSKRESLKGIDKPSSYNSRSRSSVKFY